MVSRQIPDPVPSTPQLRPKRWPIVAALVGIAVVGVLVAVIVSMRMNAAAKEREARAWSSLERCLAGEAFRDGEKPSLRVRRSQLTALGQSRTGTADAWPGTCSTYAHGLHEALKD